MFPRLKAFLATTLLILLVTSTVAWGQTGKIQGRLLIDQNPIPDESVVLRDAEDRICTGTMTDEHGEFTFSQLPPGTYKLSGRFKDYEAELECTVTEGQVLTVLLFGKKKSLFQWIPEAQPLRELRPVFTLRGQAVAASSAITG